MLMTIIIILLLSLLVCNSFRFPKKLYPIKSLADFDIFVIALKHVNNKQIMKVFPHKKINIQNGVDIRSADTTNILKSKMIDEKTRNSIINGRKYHHEIGTHGAIGLAWANKIALDKGDRDLFLLEEDYNIINYTKLRQEIEILQKNNNEFDMAIFGGILRPKDFNGDDMILKPVEWMPSGWTELNGGRFFLTHAVYYTASGRKKIRDLLFKDHIDMQIDSLYAYWAKKHNIKILVQHKNRSIRQFRNKKTTIQLDECKSCK